MILAAVLLKLGGYGIRRVFNKRLVGVLHLSPYIVGLRLIRIFFVGLICSRLRDIKALVAYSSVAHIGLVLAGLFSGYYWGLVGGLVMMVSHGLSSSGLFCLVNVYYERSGSRRLYLNKGLILIFPILRLVMFMLCAANISAPPTINLLAEIILIIRVLGFDYLMIIVFPVGSFIGAVFTLYLFSYSQHGKTYQVSINFIQPLFMEVHVLFMHIIPLNVMLINSLVFVLWL